ncbi:MAG: hypothetical protein JXQ82_01230 [Methanomicrobiaceae archaeon]|nr:hypothetical protein [Methanomicrobiaceae archaeon]
MEGTAKLLALITGVLLICVVILMIIAGFFYPGGFSVLGVVPDSTYSYDVSIKASSDITDITLFLPLPTYKEKSSVGVSIVDGEGYGFGENIKTGLFGAKDSMMLKISADSLKDAEFGAKTLSGSLIDTVNPVDNSCILSPVMELSKGKNTADYQTYVYAKYDADPECVVEIMISARGENAWSVITSKKNWYENTAILTLKGSQSGWQTAGADLKSGIGDYTIVI